MTIRVVHLIGQARWGGGEVHVRNLLSALPRDRFPSEVWLAERGPFEKTLAEMGIAHRHVPIAGQWDLPALGRLSRLLKQYRPDILQSHGARMNVFARLAAKSAGVPALSTHHYSVRAFPVNSLRKRLYDLIDRKTQKSEAGSLCISRLLWDELIERGYPSDRVWVVPNGVAPGETFSQEEARRRAGLDSKPVVLAAGRLMWEKGFDVLLEAWKKIAHRFPGARLLIAGDGPLRSELERARLRLGLEKSVELLGYRSDVRILMQACDHFVLSSRSEGLPYVVLEALHLGTPVVATEVGAVREIIRPEETGAVLVPSGDAGALAEAMARMLSSPRQVPAGQKRIQRDFSLERMSETMQKIYGTVAAKASS